MILGFKYERRWGEEKERRDGEKRKGEYVITFLNESYCWDKIGLSIRY